MGATLLLVGATVLALASPSAAQPDAARVLDWDTGAGKSYVIPALEIPAFIVALSVFNRLTLGEEDYDSDFDSLWKNLRTEPGLDRDPFKINQLGHPAQGAIYYGLARSAGLTYWESLLYTLAGSFIWETAGEKTPPSVNDHVATGIGGTFVGEAMFRMASLLLEGGGATPGFWREVGAALLSPSMGVNRLAFGERFRPVFPSRDPALFVRARLGVTLTSDVTHAAPTVNAKSREASVDYHMLYGLPGKPGYQYARPFDYFMFEFTGIPNADLAVNAVENATIRGLLAGRPYAVGQDYRGLWGLFGGYEYLSPQVFSIASTNVSLGTVGQWWLTRTVALQGTVLGGIGFGAAGTLGDKEERDYHFGGIPEVLLNLRLIVGERAMLEATGRQFHVIGTGSGGGTTDIGRELINRADVGVTVRVHGPHALSLHYVRTTRETDVPNRSERYQSVETFTLAYNFLGQTRFGAVEWRPDERR